MANLGLSNFVSNMGTSPIDSYRLGQADKRERTRAELFKSAGGQAAGGDYMGASGTLLGGGELDAGMAMGQYGSGLQASQQQHQTQKAQNMLDMVLQMDEKQRGQALTQLFSDPKVMQSVDQSLIPYFSTEDTSDDLIGLQKWAAMNGLQWNGPDAQEGFTLGQGQTRFDNQGNEIASVDPRPMAQGSPLGAVHSTFVDETGQLHIIKRDGSIDASGMNARNPYQITDVGGVPTAIDRLSGTVNPLGTAQEVGENKATIETVAENEASRREAQQGLPQYISDANRELNVINQLLEHEGFEYIYGAGSYLPKIGGTPLADAGALRDQIGGAAFLKAFESLKGGGQITEIEGQKATAAMTRLQNERISPAAARKAAAELQEVIRSGIERAKAQSGGVYNPAPQGQLNYNSDTGELTVEEAQELQALKRELGME